MWPGDTEGSRCAAAVAYNYDLLTGGGQYMYTDWRLYPEKFPYASGVTKEEPLIVRTYNLPQCYFGMYESTPHYFATSADVFSTTAPLSYATVYRNRVWEDYLIPVANMSKQEQETALVVHAPERLGVSLGSRYLLYDVNHRTTEMLTGEALAANGIGEFVIPGEGPQAVLPSEIAGGTRLSSLGRKADLRELGRREPETFVRSPWSVGTAGWCVHRRGRWARYRGEGQRRAGRVLLRSCAEARARRGHVHARPRHGGSHVGPGQAGRLAREGDHGGSARDREVMPSSFAVVRGERLPITRRVHR